MSWYDDLGKDYPVPGIGVPGDSDPQYADFGGRAFKWLDQDPGAEAEKLRKQQLYGQAGQAGSFANFGQAGYSQLGQQGNGALAALQRQAQGQDSVSAEQLRQAMQANLAQQRSLAAGASPQNAAMAARTAAIQSGRINAGMAGQQATAGLAERNQAQQQYGQLLQGLRQQDLNAALGSRQTAVSAYSAQNAGEKEKGNAEKYGPMIEGGGAALMKLMSDRRVKKNIRGGDHDASKALDGLRAYTYAYKNRKHGDGKQLGVMAQDLERAGLGQAVIDTPDGKAVHVGKLAGANTAMLAALGRRVAKLEGGKER